MSRAIRINDSYSVQSQNETDTRIGRSAADRVGGYCVWEAKG